MNPCPSSLPLNGPFIPKGEWPDFPTARSIRARDKTTIYYPPAWTPMEELTPAERASLAYLWDPAAPLLNRPTLPVQAALRIRWWAQWKGSLAETHGTRMVSYVQGTVWSRRPTMYPWMGFELIRLVDATAHQHGVHVYIGAQRLTERLEELGWW